MAGGLVGATAVLLPYQGVGLVDALWAAGAGTLFSLLNALMRALALSIDPFQAQFLRYFCGLLVLLPVVWHRGFAAYRPRNIGGQFLRGGAHTLELQPEGHAGFVQPRSGLAARHGLTLVNSPGLVDSGYRGEIRVVLLNTDAREPFVVEPGMRIAQLVVLPVPELDPVEVEELPESERGVRGFGSSRA